VSHPPVSRPPIGAREKRALVLAQNRAKAMLRKKNLSDKERKELQAIARMPLPPITKRAVSVGPELVPQHPG
jgi:hypothetical protein